MGEYTVDQVKLGGGEGLLGLDDFHIVGNARVKPLSRQVQRFSCYLNIPLTQTHLTRCRPEIEVGVPHITFHPAPGVFEFGLPLGQESLRLCDIAPRATSRPNWNIEASRAQLRRLYLRRVGSDCSVVATH